MSAPFLPRSVGRSLLDKLDVAATVPDLRRRFAIIPEPERNPPPLLHLSSFQYAATQNRAFSTLSLSFLSLFSLSLLVCRSVFRVAFPSLFSVKAGGPSKPLLEIQTSPFYIFLLSNMPPPETVF